MIQFLNCVAICTLKEIIDVDYDNDGKVKFIQFIDGKYFQINHF